MKVEGAHLADRMVAFAVVRAVQRVGQAARGVSDESRAAHPEIPWRQVIGMRHVVVRDYADVDLGLLEDVHEDLPGLVSRLRDILSKDVES